MLNKNDCKAISPNVTIVMFYCEHVAYKIELVKTWCSTALGNPTYKTYGIKNFAGTKKRSVAYEILVSNSIKVADVAICERNVDDVFFIKSCFI